MLREFLDLILDFLGGVIVSSSSKVGTYLTTRTELSFEIEETTGKTFLETGDFISELVDFGDDLSVGEFEGVMEISELVGYL